MALQNEILAGRFNQLLTRLFRITGGAPSPQMSPEVQPTYDLGEPAPEHRYLQGESLWWRGSSVLGNVGKIGAVALWNPFGTGVLATVEAMIISSQDNPDHENVWILGTTAAPSGVTGEPRDLRLNVTSSCRVKASNDFAADFPGAVFALSLFVGGNSLEIDTPVILQPGNIVIVSNTGNNLHLDVNFLWRERAQEPSEGTRFGL